MKLLAIYFTANGQRKLIDESIPIIFPHKAKGKKEEQEKRFKRRFVEFLRTPFLKTSPVAASEDEHDETTQLLHMTSRLSICYLCMICYELFW